MAKRQKILPQTAVSLKRGIINHTHGELNAELTVIITRHFLLTCIITRHVSRHKKKSKKEKEKD